MPSEDVKQQARMFGAILTVGVFGALSLLSWAVFRSSASQGLFGLSLGWIWLGLLVTAGIMAAFALVLEALLFPGLLSVALGGGLGLLGLVWLIGPGSSADLPLMVPGTPWSIAILRQLYRFGAGAEAHWNWSGMSADARGLVLASAAGAVVASIGLDRLLFGLKSARRLMADAQGIGRERYRSKETVFGDARFGEWEAMRPEVQDWPAGVKSPDDPNAPRGEFVIGEDYDPRENPIRYRHKEPETWGEGGKADLITMEGTFSSGHALVVSGSGGGKSSAYVIPTALHTTREIIFGDPDGEILEKTREAREKMGHKVRVIRKGHGFNVLALLRPFYEKENEVFTHIAGILLAEAMRGSDVGDYFREEAMNIIAALLEHFTKLDSKANAFDEIISIMTVDEPMFKEMISAIAKRHDPKSTVHRCLGNYQSVEARFFQNFSTTVRQALKWAPYQGYLDMVTKDPAGEPDLLGAGTDVYVTLDRTDMRNNPTLMRLIYGSIAYAVDRGSVERLIIIDEAAVLGRMSVFEQIRDEMRKKGARLMLIYQSLGQMVHAYGREGMRAWNNGVAVRCFSGIEDDQELRELSELIGNYTVEVDGESRAVQKRPGFLASQSQSQTNSTSLQSARLITTDQIKDLPLDAQLVFFKGQRPLLCGKAFWFRRPEWQPKPAKKTAA